MAADSNKHHASLPEGSRAGQAPRRIPAAFSQGSFESSAPPVREELAAALAQFLAEELAAAVDVGAREGELLAELERMGHWLPLFDSNAASGYLGATYLCWGPGAPVRDVSLIIETVSPGWSIIDGKRVEAAKSGEVEVTVEVDAAPVKR